MTTPEQEPCTRRTFVQGASLAVGAFATGCATSKRLTPAGAIVPPKETIKIGLIGCGGRGSGAAGQALNADPGVTLYAMGDAFPDRLSSSRKHLMDRFDTRVDVPESRQFSGFDAYQKVIDSGVDMVILTTPPHFRPEHFKAAVRGGKHVFMEKPMAVDGTGVRSILEDAKSAREQKLNIMGGFCWRYNLPNRACYERIHNGAIGDVTCVHSTYLTAPLGTKPRQDGWSDMEWQMRNWQHFNWLSGDHIAEQACHAIDKINWAKQDMPPAKAIALGGRQMRETPESGNIYDHFSVMYVYEDGSRCFHDCRQMPGCWNDNTEYLIGTHGTCYVNSWGPTQEIEGHRGHKWSYEGPNPNMYQVEHDELFEAIRGQRSRIDDIDQMMGSTLMSIMGRMSAYSGRPVEWNEALESVERLGPANYAFGDLPVMPVSVPGDVATWTSLTSSGSTS
ncbi:MAG: Gfo/Idh/MocA family oxidoreductase [Phycisphaerales bacterium]|nr:Gfo/Idh/MocA family oxidoreductase [Phycisphaerales bacterium]